MTSPTLAPSLSREHVSTPGNGSSQRIEAHVDGSIITVEIINVDPATAAEWLTRNNHNRNQRSRTVGLYADDMRNNDWRFTGASVTFDMNDQLLDGQHRLQAIVEADVSLPMLVVRGLRTEAQDDTDNGIPRKFYDVLVLRGEANASLLAALVRRVSGWEAGVRKGLGQYGATHSQLLRTLDAHPELREFCQPARRVGDGCDCPGSVISVAWWVFDRIDAEDADFFFNRLGDGQGLVKGDPIFELRRTLANAKENVRGQRSQTWMLAVLIKAWNAYRGGETVGLYRWRPGGAKPESFPEPA